MDHSDTLRFLNSATKRVVARPDWTGVPKKSEKQYDPFSIWKVEVFWKGWLGSDGAGRDRTVTSPLSHPSARYYSQADKDEHKISFLVIPSRRKLSFPVVVLKEHRDPSCATEMSSS
jgi:hypothetical protein